MSVDLSVTERDMKRDETDQSVTDGRPAERDISRVPINPYGVIGPGVTAASAASRSEVRRCVDCQHWQHIPDEVMDEDDVPVGECRRNSPAALSEVQALRVAAKLVGKPPEDALRWGQKMAAWPATFHNDWCSEFVKRPAAPTDAPEVAVFDAYRRATDTLRGRQRRPETAQGDGYNLAIDDLIHLTRQELFG